MVPNICLESTVYLCIRDLALKDDIFTYTLSYVKLGKDDYTFFNHPVGTFDFKVCNKLQQEQKQLFFFLQNINPKPTNLNALSKIKIPAPECDLCIKI